MIRARVSGGVAAQSGNAAFAASTAALSSAADASGTWEATSPVAGLYTSPNRPDVPFTCRPLIQWVSCLAIFVSAIQI